MSPEIPTTPLVSSDYGNSSPGGVIPGPQPQEDGFVDFGAPPEKLAPTYGEILTLKTQAAQELLPFGNPYPALWGGEPVKGAIPRYLEQSQLEADAQEQGQVMLGSAEANKLYPDMTQKFTTPVYPAVAAFMAERDRRVREREAWISRGEKTGIFTDLLAGLGGIADPSILLTGGLSNALLAEVGIESLTLPQTFVQQTIEGAALQVPGYLQSKNENQPTSLKQEAIGAVTSGLIGTAIHAFVRGNPEITPKATQDKILEASVNQHESGARIDPAPMIDVLNKRRDGLTAEGIPNVYEHKILSHPSERNFYVSMEADTGRPAKDGTGYAEGAHVTDNPHEANNLSGTPESVFNGQVARIEISPDAKFLSVDEPFQGKMLNQAVAEFRKLGIGEEIVPKKYIQGAYAKDVINILDSLPREPSSPKPSEVISARAKAEGFSGYSYTREPLTPSGKRTNRLIIFDPDSAKVLEIKDSDPHLVPTLDDNTAIQASKDSSQLENQVKYKKELAEEADTVSKETIDPNERILEFDKEASSALDRIKEKTRSLGIEDPEIREIEEANLADRNKIKAKENLINCLGDTI